MTAPEWTRLDNASIIYPSCKTRKYATIFRMTVTLDETVSKTVLAEALKKTVRRFPSFRYSIDKGFFWWFLRRLENEPEVAPASSMKPFSFKKNGGYMFRIGSERNRIFLDVFHALTDGTGAMTFLMSLTAEYLRRRYGIDIPAGQWVLDPEEAPAREEMEDSFDRFSGTKGSLDKESRAWHIPGREELPGVINDVRVSLPLGDLRAKAREYGCTVTEFLTAVMLLSLQELRSGRKMPGASPVIKVEVPVNLRPLFNSRTLRNFSSYVHLGIDVRNGEMPFKDIVEEVKLQKRLYVHPHRLTTRVAANVALEDNLAIRSIPLFIKKPVINFINSHKGDNYCTSTLSNLGDISLPEAMQRHVRDIEFILGRPKKRSGSVACVSYGDRLNINFTRKIVEREFEDIFIRNIESAGIRTDVRESVPSKVNKGEDDYAPMPLQWARMAVLRRMLLI